MPDPEPLLARLNDRQRRFVQVYINPQEHGLRHWGSKTEAARIAGYAWPDKQGSRLLSRPDIRAVLDAHIALCRWEWEREQLREMDEWMRSEERINKGPFGMPYVARVRAWA